MHTLLLTSLTALPAHATELVWEGHYRTQMQVFNTLSLSDSNSAAEGTAASFDHRLRLQPNWLLSENASIHTQLDLLPFVAWGDEPVLQLDPATGDELSVAYSESVGPPLTDEGGTEPSNLTVTRLWGEAWTPIGRFKVGRMPVHWGSGMVYNAGNDPWSDYGDTADRLEYVGLFGPVYVLAGYEQTAEIFVNDSDDMRTVNGGVLYRTETAGVGTYNTYRWQKADDGQFSLYTGDVWGFAEAGPIALELEFAAVVGSGDLIDTGANDVKISAFGAHLDGEYTVEGVTVGAGLGFASGDEDPEDSTLNTFTFDRDYDLGLFMFEEPMPTLAASVANEANDGRETDAIRSGTAVSNARYIRPRVGYQLMEGLDGELSLLAARRSKDPAEMEGEKGYGIEIDAKFDYRPYDHILLQTTGGLFIPGTYYSEYEHDTLGGGFDKQAYGLRVIGAVEF